MTEAGPPATSPTPNSVRLRLLAAFVVGFVGLSVEIAYTRIISFKLFYYYTYFVIGLALLGLGAASSVVALSARLRRADPLAVIGRVAPTVGATGALAYVVVARIGTETDLIWTGSRTEALEQLLRLVVISIALTGVFFGIGLMLAKLIVAEAREVRRIYFWDLTGAALGCVTAVPLQLTIGPPAMILAANAALIALGLLVIRTPGVAGGWQRGGRSRSLATAAAALVAVVVAGTLDVRTDDTKTLRDDDTVAAGDWGAVFRVDAVEFGPDLHVLHHDGLWGSAIWRYDGTEATTSRFDRDSRQLPWAALGRAPERMLIIGAAGGNEIQAALTYGVGHVDAVELNPVTEDLLAGEFADYAGNLTTRPNVDYIQGDGRTFLARSDHRYDVVWFVAPDSYAASNSATSGAFVLSESYLYTEQMITEAYDHLTPDGMIVTQFGDFAFDTRPTRTARYLVTARSALDDRIGGDDFAEHTALLVTRGAADLERASTMLLFRQPPAPAASDRITESAERLLDTEVLHLPDGSRPGAGVTTDLIVADPDGVERIVDGYGYDISSITDDRPFFWHFTPFGDVVTDWSRSFEDTEIAIGERLLLVLLGVAAVVAAGFLWLPFAVTSRRVRRSAPTESSTPPAVPSSRRRALFVYFAAIGLGFMFVEISMIQRFSLLLGYPTLSLSVSLFTLLLATAIGARVSARMSRATSTATSGAVIALWVVTGAYLLSSEAVTEAALAWNEPMRIALVVALLAPVGVLLGVFLPAGIDRAAAAADGIGGDGGRLVAWCWAVNGFFSVIGSSLTTVSSMTFGFDRTVLIGLALYVVALASFARTGSSERELRRTVVERGPVDDVAPQPA